MEIHWCGNEADVICGAPLWPRDARLRRSWESMGKTMGVRWEPHRAVCTLEATEVMADKVRENAVPISLFYQNIDARFPCPLIGVSRQLWPDVDKSPRSFRLF